MSGGGRKTLKTLIGTYPHTAPLKSGALRSDRFDFEFTEIVPVWDGFKGMIRDDRYDVSEMAIVTYLLAKAHGKPLALLPAGMIGRFQHPYAIYNASKGPMTPADLNGKRVGSAHSPRPPAPGFAAYWPTTTSSTSTASNG